MPNISKDDMKSLLRNIKNMKPLALLVSNESKEKALKECEEYIKDDNINNMTPISIYHIISRLPEDKQIMFIKENINYIKEHDNDIFLYGMISPNSLSYFLSLNVLREIKNIDKELFQKIINEDFENLVYGFSQEDYYQLYTEFYDELFKIENIKFINGIYFHNKCCYENTNTQNINNIYELQKKYNKEFILFLLDNYQKKISTLSPTELLKFVQCIDDIEIYKALINNNYDKLNIAFNTISENELIKYLCEIDNIKQTILIITFYESIIKKHDIKKLMYIINPSIIMNLYEINKELFIDLTLSDWIKLCFKLKLSNEKFKGILDNYEVDDIESLFDTNFYTPYWSTGNIEALSYIELKYRNNIQTNGTIEPINTSIFSKEYFKNLSEIKEKLKNNQIYRNDKIYKDHLANFILFLKNANIINSIEGNNFKEIEKLFNKIVMGYPISIVYKLSSIEEITLFNRIRSIDFKVEDFTVQQLEKYNVKQHKQLYKQFEQYNGYINNYKVLTLKLLFMVGFKNAKTILEIDDSLSTLEHLVGNVDVKNIILDEQGNPILNTKIMHLLFNEKDYSKIENMLSDKNSDTYRYFPRIFNEWKMIQMNNKGTSLKTIIDFLKSDEISLPIKYYRLEGLFKLIGCSNSCVNETLLLHDQMINRTQSNIPRVFGVKDGYSYEILKLDDMEGLVVGNKTNCCFTVLGNGYSCLKHALTTKNGRIFVIKKNNNILAHSWIWRNGDLLCFDNIEISKSINKVNFLDIYLQVADELIVKSFTDEGLETCIKNVTIGFTNFDRPITNINDYPYLISKNCKLDYENKLGHNKILVDVLPQPIENVEYSDSKNVQYLIRGNGKFNLGNVNCNYEDEIDLEIQTSNTKKL